MGNRIGFSTGALERSDYRKALHWIRESQAETVELSALRLEELAPMVRNLDNLSFGEFAHVSFHAPSSFQREEEVRVIELLTDVFQKGFSIIVHPDVIYTPKLWKVFGRQLLIENMDRRKQTGRTSEELNVWFKKLPEARLCLDVAHARQLDTTLTELKQFVGRFFERIAEIHISELDSTCQHKPMSRAAIEEYQQAMKPLRERNVVTIIESMLDRASIAARERELASAVRVWSDAVSRVAFSKRNQLVQSSEESSILKKWDLPVTTS